MIDKVTRTDVGVSVRSVVVRIKVEEPIVIVVVVVTADPKGFNTSVGVHVSVTQTTVQPHTVPKYN